MKLELPTRKDIPSVLNERGLIGRAVEVGVHQGKFSSEILKVWRGKCLCSIDPWIFQPEVKLDKSNVSNEEHNDCYKICVEALKPFGNRSVIIRDFSIEASRNFEDSSLDFVYLDARHDYRSVMSDLRAWWPKVKVNGIMSGHDYFDKFLRKNLVEVKRAVDTFFEFGQLEEIFQTHNDNLPSWAVIKTK